MDPKFLGHPSKGDPFVERFGIPVLSVMQLSAHQWEGYTDECRQNQPPVTKVVGGSVVPIPQLPLMCSRPFIGAP